MDFISFPWGYLRQLKVQLYDLLLAHKTREVTVNVSVSGQQMNHNKQTKHKLGELLLIRQDTRKQI